MAEEGREKGGSLRRARRKKGGNYPAMSEAGKTKKRKRCVRACKKEGESGRDEEEGALF